MVGERRPWSEGDDTAGVARGTSICGTGNGQTPFSIDANAPSNFNGFDISCTGAADGSARASATGGKLPYTYSWSTGSSARSARTSCG